MIWLPLVASIVSVGIGLLAIELIRRRLDRHR